MLLCGRFPLHFINLKLNTISVIKDCVATIRSWTSEDKLKLNDDNTEFLLLGVH